jgi:hypothetical protein
VQITFKLKAPSLADLEKENGVPVDLRIGYEVYSDDDNIDLCTLLSLEGIEGEWAIPYNSGSSARKYVISNKNVTSKIAK